MKRKKVVLVLELILLVFLIGLSVSSESGLVHTDKSEYFIGEKVNIKISLHNLTDTRLRIVNREKTYQYFNPGESTFYIPKIKGTHVIELYRLSSMLDSTNFFVISNEPDSKNASSQNNSSLSAETYENETVGETEEYLEENITKELPLHEENGTEEKAPVITLDRQDYEFGETVLIKLDLTHFEDTGKLKLRIISAHSIYNFFSTLTNEIKFTPKNPGEYELQLFYETKLFESESFRILGEKVLWENETIDEPEDTEIVDAGTKEDDVYAVVETGENISTGVPEEREDIVLAQDNKTEVIITSRSQIKIREPVKWKKSVKTRELKSFNLELHKDSQEITVKKIINNEEESIQPVIIKHGPQLSIKNLRSIEDINNLVLSLLFPEEEKESISVVLAENATEYLVEYYTESPVVIEEDVGYAKRVSISAPDELNYTNVISYTNIPEILTIEQSEGIKIYWVENNTYIEYKASDLDKDGMLDYVEWITPHLSEQTFEISLLILNVQSYPNVGGNWTVMFETVGRANLTITAIDGTKWSNINISEDKDLKFLEVKCGNQVLDYEWINNSVHVQDYECDETGYEISKVLTGGNHHLMFEFGSEVEFAHNDAVFGVMLFWNETSDAPSGWSCVSCNPGDPFYQRFPRGSDNYGGTGGATNHTHTISLVSHTQGATQNVGGSDSQKSSNTHIHPTISSTTVTPGTNIPVFRNLKIIRYDGGTPDVIPAGAIAIFNDTIPSGWTRFADQDNYFVRGEGNFSTGGSNTHTHDVSYTLDASSDTALGAATGPSIANAYHTHSVSDNSASASNVPPFIEVVFARADSDTSVPFGMIAMLNATPDADWIVISENGDEYYERFIIGNSTYGDKGGSSTNTHPNLSSITSGPSSTTDDQTGSTGMADDAHTHNVTISFSADTSLPPYIDVLFGYLADTTGPTTILDKPSDGQAVGNTTFVVNASVTDAYSDVDTVIFEYRENPSYSWTFACSDAGDRPPYECTWDLSGLPDGDQYQLRAYANDTLGNIGNTDTHINIKVGNTPTVGITSCFVEGSGWVNCTTIVYADVIDSVRTSCSPSIGVIKNVSFILKNIDDNKILFNVTTTDNSTGYWEYNLTDVAIYDSGSFNLNVICRENSEGTDNIGWVIPFGTLSVQLINPSSDRSVVQNSTFNFSSLVSCTGGECADENATIMLQEPSFDGIFFLFWSGASDAPSGWTCASCDPGDPFYNNFPRGSETYGGTGGSSYHTHSISYVSETSGATATAGTGATAVATGAHDHSSITSEIVSNESNLPSYRNLKIIQYNGMPSVIPEGAIAVFNTSTLPGGWTRYSAQDDYFIRGGGDTTTGGSNTHDHDVSYTLPDAGDDISRGGADGAVADDAHTHTVSDTSASAENVPPYIEVVLARADSSTLKPEGMIAMFSASPSNSSWTVISANGQEFYQRFLVGNSTYGDTGGNSSHTHPNLGSTTTVSSSTAEATGAGSSVASPAHTHDVTVSFSTDTNLPPYIDVIFAYYDAGIGVIPMSFAVPFWTPSDNPQDPGYNYCLANMSSGDSCPVSWLVNATGEINSTWGFYVSAIPLNYSGNISVAESSRVNITIVDMLRPTIHEIQCQEDGATWGECSNVLYSDNLTRVRVNCTVDEGTINSANFTLENLDDSYTFFSNATTYNSGDWWIFNNSDLTITDSGTFRLTVICSDDNSITETDNVEWIVPWGTLTAQLISPNSNTNVTRNQFFNFTSRVTCTGGECGYVNATLDPYVGDWWNSSYTSRKEINITNSGSVLTDFPAYLNVAYDDDMQADYDDLRFINESCGTNGSLLSYEIEYYNSTKADIWIKIPNLAVGTTSICMYYGNSTVSSGQNVVNVWDANYASIYHLNHTSGDAIDTKGFMDATNNLGGSSDPDVMGIVGRGDYFGGDGILTVTDWMLSATNGTDHTYCAWVRYTSTGDMTIIEDGGLSYGDGIGATGGNLRYAESNAPTQVDSPSTYNDDNWHYICGVEAVGGATMILYVDGEEVNTGSDDAQYGNDDGAIGGTNNDDPVFDEGSPATNHFIGYLDEIRLSYDERSADWINMSYQVVVNQASFVLFGSEEDYTGAGGGKNIIPMNSGSPFYTISDNPMLSNFTACLGNMTDGKTCDTTWEVNATGAADTTYEFYVTYASMNYSSNVSAVNTTIINITIIDNIAPVVDSVSITPEMPGVNQDLNCTFTITDASPLDVLTANMSWYKAGVLSYSEIVSSSSGVETYAVLGSGNTSNNDVWHCGVTPYDQMAYGTQVNSSTVTVLASQPPVINQVQCQENWTTWVDCSNIIYSDILTAVQVDCTDPDGYIINATFNLTNLDDSYTFFSNATTYNSGNWWIFNNSDLTITDSGTFILNVACSDNTSVTATDTVEWTLPWGTLTAQLISPNTNTNVTRNRFFNFTSRVICTGGECGYANAILDPHSADSEDNNHEKVIIENNAGLISINTNKSLYHRGEPALIYIVVLDKLGQLITDADLVIEITKPDGELYNLDEIKQDNSVYNLEYSDTSQEGNYIINVQAGFEDGIISESAYFVVKEDYEFDIIRNTPVTTDPWQGPFKSSINVISYTESGQFSFNEVLPDNFTVTDRGDADESLKDNKIILTWTGLENNSIISYSALPPLLTPMKYELGPSFIQYGNEIFYEANPWNLAVDPTPYAQDCDGQFRETTQDSFPDACDGTYPSACGASGDRLTCNDGQTETHDAYWDNEWAGVRISAYNDTWTNCIEVTQVELCYEWWRTAGFDVCRIRVDNDGWSSPSNAVTSCPGTSANPGVTCIDITALDDWDCDNFNGEGTAAQVAAQAQTNDYSYRTLTIDVLYFDVTYTSDDPPVISSQSPAANYWNDTFDPYPMTFTCNITDDINVTDIYLYITNKYNQSFGLSDSCSVSGTEVSCNWTKELANGNYTWNCLAYDSFGYSTWGENRTILINNSLSKGIIPMNSGSPFYTISDNPMLSNFTACLANMTGGKTCDTTWQVNATGIANTTWEFYVTYASLNYSINVSDALSSVINITILENIAPGVESVLLTPLIPVSSDNLNCTFTVSDASQLDVLTANISWYKNGVLDYSEIIGVTNGVESSHFLGSGNTSIGDVWHCGVTPYDQVEYGAQVNSSTVSILASRPPEINQILCLRNYSTWIDCSDFEFGEIFSGVQANCTSEEHFITNVTFNLTNIPDSFTYFKNTTTNNSTNWWRYYQNITLNNSGEYQLYATCFDSNGSNTTSYVNWNLPWGTLVASLVDPDDDISVQYNAFFPFTAQIACIGGECGNVEAELDPVINWWNCSFDARKEINITNVGSIVLSDFPLYINVTYDSDMQADYDDLRFINGSCNDGQSLLLDHEIEDYDSSHADVWVRIPSLPVTGATICMYYKNSDVGSGEDMTGVWDGSYDAVHHLQETSGNHQDSTSVNNDATATSVSTEGGNIGMIDGADDFDDSNTDYVTFTTTGMRVAAGTISLWVNMDHSSVSDDRSYFFSHRTGSDNNRIYIFEESGVLFVGFANVFQNNIGYTIDPDEWHYYTLKWTGGAWEVFVDGVSEGSGSNAALTSIDTNSHLGAYLSSDEWLDGMIDEFRMSNVSRSDDWINQSYQMVVNQDSFIIFGSEEPYSKGTISTQEGATPFYTTDANPQNYSHESCLENLISGQTCQVSWQVNATGEVGSTHEFFVIFNLTSNQAYLADTETAHIYITIEDASDVPPVVSLVSPENNNVTNNLVVVFNCSATDNLGLQNMTLYANFSGTFESNGTNSISGTSNSTTFSRTLNDGVYSWTCLGYDTDGNYDWATSNWTLTVDTTKPAINLSAPPNGDNSYEGTQYFNFTVADNLDPVLVCNITLDSGVADENFDVDRGILTSRTIVGIPQGTHYWNISCIDNAGNLNTSETWNFSIVDIAPNVTLITQDNISQSSSLINLQYNATDNNNVTEARLIINGELNDTDTQVEDGTVETFTVTGLAEGRYNWTVNVSDISNLTAQAPVRWFIIDKTAPAINLTNPENNASFNSSSIEFNFTVIDNFDTQMQCNITINNTVMDFNFTANNNSNISRTISDLIDGIHFWNVSCVDDAGNVNTSETRNFSISAPPAVELNSPPENYSQNTPDITFYYTPTDNTNLSQCDLILNNAVNLTNTTIYNGVQNNFTLSGLSSGYYNWTVNCTDITGLSMVASPVRTFTIDFVQPSITLYNPSKGGSLYALSVTFNYSVVDDFDYVLLCNITLDGNDNFTDVISPNNTFVNRSLAMSTEGTHYWNVTCSDDAGNANTSETWNFTIYIPPDITLISPDNNAVFGNGTNIEFEYTVTDSEGVANASLIINNEINQTDEDPSEISSNYFYVNFSQDGVYTWTVRAFDSNGLGINATPRTLIVDTTPPIVIINHPYENETFSWNNVTFNFSVTDNLDDELICNITIDEVVEYENITVNNGSTELRTKSMNDGNYNWSVTCIDHANNTNIYFLTNFTVDAPPNVTLIFPIDYYRTNDVDFTFNYTPEDAIGLEICILYFDGQQNDTDNEIEENTQNFFSLDNLPAGIHNWTIQCYDSAPDLNNYTADYEYFFIDHYGPAINLVYPGSAQTMNQDYIDFNWTATDWPGTTINCNITVSDPLGERNATDVSGISGEYFNTTLLNLSDGIHYWNITCVDDLGNMNSSETWNFTINQPDLFLNNSMLWFNNSNPDLNENITIFANVTNIGGNPVTNLFVEFWDGLPGIGNYIGNDTKNVDVNATETFTVTWLISSGYHNIWVIADPDDAIEELNETNNNATINISVLGAVITSPENNSWTNSLVNEFNFTLYDYTSGIINYSIYIDGTPNSQNGTVTDGDSNLLNITLTEGTHYVQVRATDALSRTKMSSRVYINVDVTDPTPAIETLNNTFFNDTTPEIRFNITDNMDNEINYTLYVDGVAKNSSTAPDGVSTSVNLSTLDEGKYELILEALDEAGNRVNSTPVFIYVDITEPTISLLYPQDTETFNVRNTELNFTVIDNLDEVLTCNLTLDSSVVRTNFDVNNNTVSNYSVSDLSEGKHYWNVTCWDGRDLNNVNNINISETRSFNIYIAPEIELIAPLNNTWNNSQDIVFLFNVTDDSSINNCSLILNNEINQTRNTSQIINGGISNFTVTDITSKFYNWSVICFDQYDVQGNSTTWLLKADKIKPAITLNAPENGYNTTSASVTFNFSVIDNLDDQLICNLTLDGEINISGITAYNNSENISSISNLTEGTHYWNITCIDEATNINTSETRSFSIYIAPEITLIAPDANNWTNQQNVTFYFNVSDDTGIENCSILINNQVNDTKDSSEIINNAMNNFTVNYLDGIYNWSIECYDNTSLHMYTMSENRTLYVDLYEPEPYIETENKTWFYTATPLIYFNITDNMDSLLNYTFYVDDSLNVIGTADNATSTSVNLATLTNGSHTVVLEAVDNAGNRKNSTPIVIYIDTGDPWIVLNYPGNGNETYSNMVTFNFTAYDDISLNLTCNLTLDAQVIAENINVTNGTPYAYTHQILTTGIHYWNVTCVDMASNFNTSETWNFSVPLPDLTLNSSHIMFNNSQPEQGENITINATIFNLGESNAENVTVQFFIGNWTLDNQINGNRTISINAGENITVNVSWITSIPNSYDIYVVVDPPIETNGDINEINESNNYAYRTLVIGSYNTFYGNFSGVLNIKQNQTNMTVFEWSLLNFTGSNIYAADYDSIVDWTNLQAISRDISDLYVQDDFNEIDIALQMENNTDSINLTYTENLQPKATATFTVYTYNIDNVPVVNSTNISNFITGILWDTSDGNTEFDASQDLVFITQVNEDAQGMFGVYDFEFKVPSNLKLYRTPDAITVALYTEIK
ncbi:DUF2341 domain-containing protein [Candidatus Woesearchaeota archaeon]|nr:DUF2341 domain-containing protein [Candidatus Woesearchaeota archaeon]